MRPRLVRLTVKAVSSPVCGNASVSSNYLTCFSVDGLARSFIVTYLDGNLTVTKRLFLTPTISEVDGFSSDFGVVGGTIVTGVVGAVTPEVRLIHDQRSYPRALSVGVTVSEVDEKNTRQHQGV